MAKRRTAEEVAKLIVQIDELRAGGMTSADAADKVGLAKSVYDRYKSGKTGKRVRGSVNANSIPPRPKKGKRPPKPVNLHDVQSVAARIGKIDRKLKEFNLLTNERRRLATHLMGMLDPKKG